MSLIRWGIIGCGDVTEVKSGPALQKARGSALINVMRRNGDLAADYARRHGVPRWTDDAQTLIDDPEVDAVYVATPPSTHKQYTLMAAAAGKPVYVEKPMAMNYGECLAMVDACRAADVPLFVAYYRRSLTRFVKVGELLADDAIGEVRFVTVTLAQRAASITGDALPWRIIPEIAGGGLFVDLASHTLDLLDHLLGPIDTAQGLAGNQAELYPAEDIVSGSFVFQSGVQGAGVWCFTAFDEQDRVEISGSRGRISFSTFGANDPVRLVTAAGETDFHIEHPPHVQQPLIQTIVDELQGIGVCPSTGESGARTSRVMDALLGRLSPSLTESFASHQLLTNQQPMNYIFNTSHPTRYRFPTHINDLVMDRADAATSEVFIVEMAPGEAPPLHQHGDTEQVFYVLQGRGRLTIGAQQVTFAVAPGDVVRVPPGTLHSIECQGDDRLRYLAVDCFLNGRPTAEPTWDDHVRVVCGQQGWRFEDVVTGRN